MRYLLLLLLLNGSIDATAQELRFPPSAVQQLMELLPPVNPKDRDVPSNQRILGPTGELLPPYLATRSLGPTDYFEWCLRWNARQYELAKERAVPPRVISGRQTDRRGYSRGWAERRRFATSRFGRSFGSTTLSREQNWYIGGYGGGPVTIYNPFVPPSETVTPSA